MNKEFTKYKDFGAYHWIWGTRERHWYKKMVDLNIKEFPVKGSILDIGCGDGYVCGRLKDLGFDVEGFDSDVNATFIAKMMLPNVKIYLGDITNIKFDRHFDYFIAQNIIEHLKDVSPLVNLFDKYCDKYMILATDIQGKLGKFEYGSYSYDDICGIFQKYKVEKLYEFRKVYGVKISK